MSTIQAIWVLATTTPSYDLHVNGTVAGTGSFVNTSDRRLKRDIQPLSGGLATIARLQGVAYVWKDPVDEHMQGEKIGLIAQDVQAVVPQAVLAAGDDRETLSVDYNAMIPLMIEAIKELKAANEELRKIVEQQGRELALTRRVAGEEHAQLKQ